MGIVRILAFSTVVAACGVAVNGTPAADFTEYLASYGQVFTPATAPVNAVDWRPALGDFPFPGAQVASAIYGVVSCVDPKPCFHRGLVEPGKTRAIWIISFVESPAADGCPVWASVDATTGGFINGTGPPCR